MWDREREKALGAVEAARQAAAVAAEHLRILSDRWEAARRAATALKTAARRYGEKKQRVMEKRAKSTFATAAAADAQSKALAECEAARSRCKAAEEARANISAALDLAAVSAEGRLLEASRKATALETEARGAAERMERCEISYWRPGRDL